MISRTTIERFWLRGLWVFLMMVLINVSLGSLAGGMAVLLGSLLGFSLGLCYLLFLLVVGLPCMGWIFEQFATRLPRLRSAESTLL
jgi:hypothetical protein